MLSFLLKKSAFFRRVARSLVGTYFRNVEDAFAGLKFDRVNAPPNWSFDAMASSRLRVSSSAVAAGQEFRDVFDNISAYWRESSKSGALKPDFWDLLQLARLISHLEAKSVIEFGSGNSTVVGMTMCENFTSVDADDDYAAITRSSLVAAGFSSEQANRVITARPDIVVAGSKSDSVWEHDVELGPADFIYLDGPPLTKEVSVAGDILTKNLAGLQTAILIDGRKDNAIWLRDELRLVSPGWNLFCLPYPSNDALIIHSSNPKYQSTVEGFFLNIV